MPAPERPASAGHVPAVMLQGTGSDVGKSLLVAGLARAFTRLHLAVRPFKPQNMSNNAAVTADGGEIGRAQALQARACGIAPSVDMNPVLLKPQSEIGAQIVVQGRVEGNAAARDYHALKPKLLPRVLESFARLSKEADLLLVEGAGSPAEINLRDGDIANMGFADAADVPVILVADIDRGGVIASLVGTVAVLEPAERARLKGFIVNKFRGDKRLFDSGVHEIEARTGLKCLGVVPWFADAVKLPAEDAAGLDSRAYSPVTAQRALRIAVPHLSHIANFDDFDPLAAEPDVVVTFVPPGRPLPLDADAIIIPGSKATLDDLAALRREGWDIDLAAYARSGGRILGLCGGYQMLGTRVSDPEGIEGSPGDAAGLGLLNVETILEPAKILRASQGTTHGAQVPVRGYEIHMGRTSGPDTARPLLDLGGRADGAISADARIAGCYLHGLFTSDEFRGAWLASLRAGRETGAVDYDKSVDDTLDRLADHLAQAIDLPHVLEIARAR